MSTKPMILVTSSWENQRTFKMIPISKDCIYNECIFDPENRVLAIVSKEYKKNFQMIPRLYNNGLAIREEKERVQLDTYYEYFIEDEKEIISFIESMANNSEVFNFKIIIRNSFAVISV